MGNPKMGCAGLILIVEAIIILAVLSGGTAMARHHKKKPTASPSGTPTQSTSAAPIE